MSEQIEVTAYLIIGAKFEETYKGSEKYRQRGTSTVRVSKGKPSTRSDELPIRLNFKLPVGLFIRPTLTAHVTIPDGMKLDAVVPADVQHNIADAIKKATGQEVRLTVDLPDQP